MSTIRMSFFTKKLQIFMLLSMLTSISAKSITIYPSGDPNTAPDISAKVNPLDPYRIIELRTFANTAQVAAYEPTCWSVLSVPSVWVKLRFPSSGLYTITSNVGLNEFARNSRMALWSSGAAGPGTLLACNEDSEDPCNPENTTAGFTIQAQAGTDYLIQLSQELSLDFYMGLMIYQPKKASNDCIENAIDLQPDYNLLSGSPVISTKNYPYIPFVYTPNGRINKAAHSQYVPNVDKINTPVTNDRETSVCAYPLDFNYEDVWFRFTYNSSLPALLNVYNTRGAQKYAMQLFKVNGGFGRPGCGIGDITAGIERLGCSAPDGLGINGPGNGDWAKGDFTNHARVNLSLLGLKNNDEVYVRVYSVSPAESVVDLCPGMIQMVFETIADPLSQKGYDGYSFDNPNALRNNGDFMIPSDEVGDDFNSSWFNLSNAGMRGGLSLLQGSTAQPSGSSTEAGQYIIPSASTIEYSYCSDTHEMNVEPHSYNNNNSAYYSFEVKNSIKVVPLPDTILMLSNNKVRPRQSTRDSVDGDEDNGIVVIIDSTYSPVNDEFWISIAACSGIYADSINEPILNSENELITPDVYVPTGLCDSVVATCGADVTVGLKNLQYFGVAGNTVELVVIPEVANSTLDVNGFPSEASFGGIPALTCRTGYELYSSNFYLPEGIYHIVVDGEDGNIATYDMDLDIAYFVPGTNISCAGNPEYQPQYRKTESGETGLSLFEIGMKPIGIYPVPASDNIQVDFLIPEDGQALFFVSNMLGEVVYQERTSVFMGENSYHMNVNGLENGVYLLNCVYHGLKTSIKLVVNH